MACEDAGDILTIAKTAGNTDILNRAVACEQFFCKPVDSIVQNELIYGRTCFFFEFFFKYPSGKRHQFQQLLN